MLVTSIFLFTFINHLLLRFLYFCWENGFKEINKKRKYPCDDIWETCRALTSIFSPRTLLIFLQKFVLFLIFSPSPLPLLGLSVILVYKSISLRNNRHYCSNLDYFSPTLLHSTPHFTSSFIGQYIFWHHRKSCK